MVITELRGLPPPTLRWAQRRSSTSDKSTSQDCKIITVEGIAFAKESADK